MLETLKSPATEPTDGKSHGASDERAEGGLNQQRPGKEPEHGGWPGVAGGAAERSSHIQGTFHLPLLSLELR